MGSQKYLAICMGKEAATVVCIDSQDRAGKILGCFNVSLEPEQQGRAVADLIGRGCAEREWQFSEAVVALDCALFMQHSVHSEFSDAKQIATTVRFDTEECLATDVTDLAIAFQITSSNEKGSELTVFTAKHKVLSEIITSLQSNNIDPVAIKPDVSCLSRFVRQKLCSSEEGPDGTLFGLLSERRGYLVIPAGSASKEPVVRTFLVGPTQDKSKLLSQEVLVTTALARGDGRIGRLRLFDSTGSLDIAGLSQRLGMEAAAIDEVGLAGGDDGALGECTDAVGFAIAYGAALGHFEKAHAVNFRDDYMPYQGKRVRLQNTLKYLSMSLTVFLMAVGLYFHTQLFGVNKSRQDLNRCLARDYASVMVGQKLPKRISALTKLRSEWTRLRTTKDPKTGGDESMVSRAAAVLKPFNDCAAQTNWTIDSLTITDRNISITGDTSGARNTLVLFDTIKKSGLQIAKQTTYTKGGRGSFSITLVPNEGMRTGK